MKISPAIHTKDQVTESPQQSALNFQSERRGSVLVGALLIVVIVTALVGVAFIATNGASRMGGRGKEFVGLQRAAEAAVEYGYGIWKQRIFAAGRPISTAEASAGLISPAMPGFSYASAAQNGPLAIYATDQFGAPFVGTGNPPTRVLTNLSDYPGFVGFASSYLVSAKMQVVGNLGSVETVGVRRRFQYIEVPLFQTMYFFEHDLTIFNPAPMIVGGLVHTNSDLYTSTYINGGLTFTGNLSYANNYYTTSKLPPFSSNGGGGGGTPFPPIYPNGEANQVTKVARYEPLGLTLASVFNTTDTNQNNDGYRELIELPVAGVPDPPEIATRRLSNKAGLVMTINGTTATVTTQNGTSATPVQIAAIKGAFTGKTTIFDQREGKTVDVANIDVSKLTAALNTGGPTNFNGVLYVVDVTPVTTSGPSPSPNPKTVRLKNGGVLPDAGLTIASQNPVYVQGDYNTGTSTSVPPTSVPANATGNPTNADSPTAPGYIRKPAAVMGDAVMLLSNAWNDANSSSSLSSRTASNTTYNMAILAGFMPSGYQPTSGAQYGYSGGAHNFARFLETWNGKSCTYYGSMVELFQSGIFKAEWDLGNVYQPPNRRYNYDPNYATNPPPGGTDAALYTRGAWSKF
jgi:hypothetical protein